MKPRVKTGKRIHGKYNSNPLTKIPNPCCFFKLIVSPSIQLKNLRLPETFARAYRSEISEACHLTVPTGETHQVALVEQDCKLWFRDGWEQFVDRFSIGFGFFIVFTYVGNSNFKVNLFDPTACEISYSCDKYASSPMQSSEPNLGDHIPELSEEFNGDDQMNVDEENTHLPSADREKSEVDVKLLNKDVEIKLEELSDTDVDTRKETEGSQLGIELPIWLSNCKEELKAVAASGFPIPTNPFFVALMKSYVLTNGFLGIPIAFARCHMNCKAGDLIKIEMWDGKHWLVRCCRSRTYFSFGKGWLQFVRHACLEVGDVCLFELTDAKNCVLKVHISKFF
ncbi:B3 domain-containing transcription factor VRN1-like [Silene latifolia]|uniref:B3 domain-containing transcription factor VRN1-like n=1 Tax=Silene latifolia TaxID=37657 RepID=UPI003D77DD47